MKIIVRLLFIVSISGFSQVGGESVYNFLNVPTSAKQAALGGKIFTLIDDVNQPFWNPSTINLDMDNQLGVNYLNFLTDINYGSASFAHMINRNFGTLQGGFIYANYGEFIEADEDGNELGTFRASDMAFSLGYAYQFSRSNFSAGVNLRVINSVIANFSSFGLSADFGLIYKNSYKPYVFTLVLRNVGTQITTFDGEKEKIPLEVALGASYRVENVPVRLHFTLGDLQQWNLAYSNPSNSQSNLDGSTVDEEISAIDNAFRHMVIGAELFPEGGFNIRMGYNFRRAKELQLAEIRTFAGFSVGFGLKMGRFKLNYAYTKYHPAENSSTFSLLINLNDRY